MSVSMRDATVLIMGRIDTGLILGDFRNNHTHFHSKPPLPKADRFTGLTICKVLGDMMGNIWGRAGSEIVGFMTVVGQILVTAGGIVTTGTAFNALTDHSACTAVFALVSAILITMCSSIRTFSKLGWLTWFGFVTFTIAIFVFTVAVSQVDRPAAAPEDFELGFVAIAYPTFILGMVASVNIFIFSAGTSMFLPVISEMKRPQDYRKACIWSGVIIGLMYLVFSLVIYRYCGIWLSTPAFGSAGTLIKKISYGIAMPGLLIGVGIYQHVPAKYLFVRFLRNSKHLQKNSFTHWGTWLGINFALGSAAYIVAEAVPILNYLLALAGAVVYVNFSFVFPAFLWMDDHKGYRSGTLVQQVKFWLHVAIALLGVFMMIGGT